MSNKKKRNIFGLLLILLLIMTGFMFIRSHPHFENFLLLFRSSPYEKEEIFKLEIDEMSKINELFALKNGWGIHLSKSQEDKIIFLDENLEVKDEMDLNTGSEVINNIGEYGYLLLINPEEKIMVFNEEGELSSEINLDEKTKISNNKEGILLGENQMEINQGLNYNEVVKWFDKGGELIKELNFENMIILESIKNEYWEEIYLGMTFSKNPKLMFIDEGEKEKVLDLRFKENDRLIIKSKGRYIIVGNNRRLIFLENTNRNIFELDKEYRIKEICILNNENIVLVSDNDKRDKNVIILRLSVAGVEIKKQRPIRGSLINLHKKSDKEFVLATSTHLYNFNGRNFKVYKNPWGEISKGSYNLEGNKFLTANEENGEIILFKEEDDKK